MAWETGPYFLEDGRTLRVVFWWSDRRYRGIQMIQPRPQRHGEGSGITVVGGRVELAVTSLSVVFNPSDESYEYAVDVEARDGDWYQFNMRGENVG